MILAPNLTSRDKSYWIGMRFVGENKWQYAVGSAMEWFRSWVSAERERL